MIMTERFYDYKDGTTSPHFVWAGELQEAEEAFCPLRLTPDGNMKPCAGHTCAAWRWARDTAPRDVYNDFWDKSGERRGYCGLAGVPHDLSL